jgi:nucleoid DNA-binding protein
MIVTREMLIKRLASESGYYEKDIRHVLHCLDDVVLECFAAATDDEEIAVQLVKGVKIGCTIQPERTRKDPRTQADIICLPTCKPNAKFSQDFRRVIQEQYDAKKDG